VRGSLSCGCCVSSKEIMSDWEDDATCSSFQMSSGAAFVPDYYAKKGELSD